MSDSASRSETTPEPAILKSVKAYMALPEQGIAESNIDDNMYELDEMLRHLYLTAEALDRLTAGKMIGAISVEWQGKRQSISMLAPASFRYIAKKIDRLASYDEDSGEIVRAQSQQGDPT